MPPRSNITVRIAVFAALFIVAVLIVWRMLKPSDTLPIYHPAQLDARLVQPGLAKRSAEHHITDFDLIDQNGEHVSLATSKGKVIMADFFFTSCTSICPKMSAQMERIQAAFKDDDRVLLLSHSVTPEMDSVPVLKAYADLHHADHARWRLMTGDRKQIYALARTSWFAVLDEGDGGPDDFVHTENFILADPQGRLRGFYDGTSTKDIDRAIDDMHRLLKEQEEGSTP